MQNQFLMKNIYENVNKIFIQYKGIKYIPDVIFIELLKDCSSWCNNPLVGSKYFLGLDLEENISLYNVSFLTSTITAYSCTTVSSSSNLCITATDPKISFPYISISLVTSVITVSA